MIPELESEKNSAYISIVSVMRTGDPAEIQLEAIKSIIETFQKRTFNAALDACRDSVPAVKNYPENRQFQEGSNAFRKKALSAIDSLRPLVGKEV